MGTWASAAQRSAATAVLLAVALTASQCGEVVPATIVLEGVLGVEAECAARVVRIDLEVRGGGQTEIQRSFPVTGRADLPIAVSLPSVAAGTAEHEVRVGFHVRASTPDVEPSIVSIGPFGYPDGTAGRVVYVLPCTCIGVDCGLGQTCAERPAGSGHAVCVAPATCGDGACDVAEQVTCPGDCAVECGDGVCGPGDTCASCPIDCGACCGDGVCAPDESLASCPLDCGSDPGFPPCGDGLCEGGETCGTCAADCCCTDPCCVAPGPCCGDPDPCCGDPDPCCGKAGLGGACAVDSDCCSARCAAGACAPPCTADAAPCASASDCCSARCSAGLCGAPPRVTKVVVDAANDVNTPAFAQTAQLFFITDVEPFWDEAKSATLPLPKDGVNHDLVFDLSSHPRWTGTVTRIRFDPMNCTTPTLCDVACFNVGSVRVLDEKGGAVQTWTFLDTPQDPIPSPFHGWSIGGATVTWSDGVHFGGCVDPAIPPPDYGDIRLTSPVVSIPVQP